MPPDDDPQIPNLRTPHIYIYIYMLISATLFDRQHSNINQYATWHHRPLASCRTEPNLHNAHVIDCPDRHNRRNEPGDNGKAYVGSKFGTIDSIVRRIRPRNKDQIRNQHASQNSPSTATIDPSPMFGGTCVSSGGNSNQYALTQKTTQQQHNKQKNNIQTSKQL